MEELLIMKLINYLDSIVFGGKVLLEGEYVDYPIFKTKKDGNSLKKYIYLDVEVGKIEDAQLVTNTGEILSQKNFNITKNQDGIVIVFEFKIDVEEVI